MDGEGRRAKRPAVGGDSSTSSTSRPTRGARGARGGRGTAGGSTRMPSKQAEVIARHLNSGSTLVSRISNVSTRSQRGPVTLVWLKVKGLKESKAASNPGGGLKDLLHFLERKATSLATRSNNRPVAIKQHREQGDYVLVAATSEDSEELLKVNSFTFAGTALSVEIDAQGGPEPSADVKVLRDHLQSILSVRYIGENKLLKLDALSADPAIVQAGLLDSSERAEKMFKALMRVCDDLFKTRKDKSDAIESISVANNSIDNVVSIAVLGDTFPDLQNLDLSGNNISTIDGLRGLRGKFKRLRALYLANNPIEAGQPDYKTTMLEWFPTLQDLNGIQVRTPEQAAAAEAASLPRPFPQGGPDFRDANSIGENFLLDFFTNYDNNRPQIVAKYYDETSAFSLAVDTNSARDPNQPAPTLGGISQILAQPYEDYPPTCPCPASVQRRNFHLGAVEISPGFETPGS
ncbi:unnamed protein product [Parascedosporium putredinis]|uniref:NTF2 domain-containing protein n=1 Tax=Parascedosporium putredinis TaxID=1442378 RepID=A0A9P1H0I6_9PEZI|nr:unnamed protein product [Parascedosporium putredinis]CAI7992844.1 unnamed protein product [Parascedosporium putredinis]